MMMLCHEHRADSENQVLNPSASALAVEGFLQVWEVEFQIASSATNAIKAAATTPNLVTVVVTKCHVREGIRPSIVVGRIQWSAKTNLGKPVTTNNKRGLSH